MATERNWRQAMKAAIRDPDELCRIVGLDARWREPARRAAAQFPVFAPLEFLARVVPGDPFDPLLRQVLPLAEETIEVAGFSSDPVGDGPARREAGLLQKYSGRALLITTGACAVHCRYCFRRAFPYAEHGSTSAGIDAAVAAVAGDPSIREVILSGGDPLLLDDARLGGLVARILAIPTVARLRIHTRLPIVIPSRVTPGLGTLLAAARTRPVVVIHANHPAEIDADVAGALGRLASAGVVLLNQAVLLAGVNDSAEAQIGLAERLLDAGVLPYYLHLPDRVAGTAHFDVSEAAATRLLAVLRERLPGYAVPRLVREVPGEPSKVVIA